jgi:phosphatidate cytidylyltransferase
MFLAIVLSLFVVGGIFIAVAERLQTRRVTEIWRIYRVQFVVTAWMVVPAWLGGPWFVGAILVMAAVSSWELFDVLLRMKLRPLRYVGVAASVGYCVLGLAGQSEWLAAAPIILAVALLGAPVLGVVALEGAFVGAATTLLGTLYPGLFLSFAARLGDLGNRFGDFVYLYAVLEINDACAFLFGKYLGKRRLAPTLSPNKTRGGSIGGLCCAIAAGAGLAPVLIGLGPVHGAVIGAVLGVTGQIADLAASAIKRQAGVKDYSNLVPTQGGMLDLYDSFIFAAPLWFMYLGRARGAL